MTSPGPLIVSCLQIGLTVQGGAYILLGHRWIELFMFVCIKNLKQKCRAE